MKFNLNTLKTTYIGKVFGWLTVEDVIRENGELKFKCLCKCGNVKYILKKHLLDGKVVSCGCYQKSKEKAEKYSDLCKNNPDKIKEKVEKQRAYYQEHPDQLIFQGIQHSEWIKQHPEECYRLVNWHKDNPELSKKASEKHSLWYKLYPDRAQEVASKISQSCTDEERKLRSERRSLWYKENPDKAKEMNKRVSETLKLNRINERKQLDYSQLYDIIHPDDLDLLSQGIVGHDDYIRVLCDKCNKYSYHKMEQIFSLKKETLIRDNILCDECCKITSQCEEEIATLISSIYGGACIRNSRNIIAPYELDLYYPDKSIAVEFNGMYWHNDQHKSKEYHFNKFKMCKDKNIRLISIFEQDWMYNKDKVTAIIREAFSSKVVIYARKCKVVSLQKKESRNFINLYHYYGDSRQSQICYGLYYNDELLSCMTFGNLRGNRKDHNEKNYYELVRFVTKPGYQITGGASKLFSRFIQDHNPAYILCYSDNDFFTGNTYKKLGFTLKSLGEKSIDYQWCGHNKALMRQMCMPKRLLETYPQYRNMPIKGSVEAFIMKDLGYTKVYRCGNSVWEWNNLLI